MKLEEFQLDSILTPTRTFEVGEEVEVGHLDKVVIKEIGPENKVYVATCWRQERAGAGTSISENNFAWYSIFKKGTREINLPSVFVPDNIRHTQTSSSVEGMFTYLGHFGIDMSPDYQRGNVWTLEQKIALIETILDRGGIGAFSLNRRNFVSNEKNYEIIDGKQRLTALWEFYQDKFPVRGHFYSEWNNFDKYDFKNKTVGLYILEEATREMILRFFLRINRMGTPVDSAHIKKVEAMVKKIA